MLADPTARDRSADRPSLDVSRLSTEELRVQAAEISRDMASLAATFLQLTAELDRREGWSEEGATSLPDWIVERCGLSQATAKTWAHVGERLSDLPHLSAGLRAGEVSLDKVRALVDTATPETDHELTEQAKRCSVRQLAELARARMGRSAADARRDEAARSVRFNDTFRTVTAQLPPESYAEVRSGLEARARRLPSDGETPWDQRLCDAFLHAFRSGTARRPAVGGVHAAPFTVVAHVGLATLMDDSNLAGQLERGEWISAETVRRLACDATVVVAVDDDVGHTMYEGRARRDPTDTQRREIWRRDCHCRFPGCSNSTFTNAHHVVPWITDGPTDLCNLALLCEHHHHVVHRRTWKMWGNANEELCFLAPSGRMMTSRPSPLWTTLGRPVPSAQP